jgi:hypothetical protein
MPVRAQTHIHQSHACTHARTREVGGEIQREKGRGGLEREGGEEGVERGGSVRRAKEGQAGRTGDGVGQRKRGQTFGEEQDFCNEESVRDSHGNRAEQRLQVVRQLCAPYVARVQGDENANGRHQLDHSPLKSELLQIRLQARSRKPKIRGFCHVLKNSYIPLGKGMPLAMAQSAQIILGSQYLPKKRRYTNMYHNIQQFIVNAGAQEQQCRQEYPHPTHRRAERVCLRHTSKRRLTRSTLCDLQNAFNSIRETPLW